MKVKAFDPKGIDNARIIFKGRIQYMEDAYEALAGADCLLIITEWNMFKSPDIERIKSLLKKPVIFDARNILNPVELRASGFTYFGIGRP